MTPDETPRATLAEDEREALMLAMFEADHSCAHNMVPIFAAIERIIATHVAPLLAAARAAGVAQGRAEAAAAIRAAEHAMLGDTRAEFHDRAVFGRAARIAEGAEQGEDA